ncbi:permease prefix domain 1-containing protein [Pseudidiomarina marina]|uniref:permease prefix domain 1-containing protein n=1 Tax=Pseudidiomarina marina TaxID=502366 RepID=UPI00384C8ADC
MMSNSSNQPFELEQNIAQWREFVLRRAAILEEDADELESHLRDQIDALLARGLHVDEAFLVATKRIGNLEAVSKEYAEVHAGRLWRNIVWGGDKPSWNTDFYLALLLACCAAVLFHLPKLFGFTPETHEWVFARNFMLFCLPMLGAYYVVKHQLGQRGWYWLIGASLGIGTVINLMPWQDPSATQSLSLLHLPLFLWFLVGILYTGNWWQTDGRRMDFIRYSGEYAIYFVLLALGGAVLTALTIGMFSFIGMNIEWFAQQWLIPSGVMGAVIIVGWLVEAKQGAVENMAPVLARIFTPLFTLLLLTFLVIMLVSGRTFDVERELLIGLDALLIVVLGLVLYAVSSRESGKAPSLFDRLQWLLIVAALLVDLLALAAIASRIADMGFTANRTAALGENFILLVSLSGYAWLYWQFIRGQWSFALLEQWQTRLIPVYAIWAASVVFIFPLIFGF